MTITTFGIGTTYAGIASLKSLGLPAPLAPYRPGEAREIVSSGNAIDTGSPLVTWRFGFLTAAQRETLRDFCAGASASVYIWTKVNDSNEFRAFSAIMYWPEEENRAGGKRLDFVIEFRYLVDVTPA